MASSVRRNRPKRPNAPVAKVLWSAIPWATMGCAHCRRIALPQPSSSATSRWTIQDTGRGPPLWAANVRPEGAAMTAVRSAHPRQIDLEAAHFPASGIPHHQGPPRRPGHLLGGESIDAAGDETAAVLPKRRPFVLDEGRHHLLLAASPCRDHEPRGIVPGEVLAIASERHPHGQPIPLLAKDLVALDR